MTWMYYNKHRAAAYYDYPNVAFGYDDLDAKMGAYETNLGFTWRQIGFTRETLGFDFPTLRHLEVHITMLVAPAAPSSPAASPTAALLQRLSDGSAPGAAAARLALTGACCHLPYGLTLLLALGQVADAAHNTAHTWLRTHLRGLDRDGHAR